MTYNDLCNDVISLGFESELESHERMLSATRRALAIIYTERPIYKKLTVMKPKNSLILKTSISSHTGGEDLTVKFEGAKAYTFKTDGVGKCVIRDANSDSVIDFSGCGELHRGFLHGSGSLTFTGEFSYTVYELAVFGEIYSGSVEDIPSGAEFTEYDMRKYRDDFLTFASLPTDERSAVIKGAAVSGYVMTIPDDYTGRINLTYKSAPPRIYGNADTEIELSPGCEHLAALLVAAYIWLDDDAERAQYYMNLYREGMNSLKRRGKDEIDNGYHSVNGWA